MKTQFFYLTLLCWLACVFSGVAAEPLFQVDFVKDGLAGWNQTKAISAEMTAEGVKLVANGWDAKLYRDVELPPGRYVLYARGRGHSRVFIVPDWKTPPKGLLNLSSPEAATVYGDFQIPEGAPLKWIVVVFAPKGEEPPSVAWLRIEAAPGVPSASVASPKPEELEKERPEPPTVRGFMTAAFEGVTPEAMAEMKAWGANVIRLQVKPVQRAKALKKPLAEAWPEILDELDRTVASAEATGLKVIVDLHEPPLPEIVESHGFDQPALWHAPDLEKSMVQTWSDIAKKLKPRAKTIWGYDLLNEPLDRSQLPWPPKEWYPLAVKVVEAIRQVDPAVWIVYEPGPGGMSRGYQGLLPLPDRRVIYSIHDYSPAQFTHQGIAHVGGFDHTDIATKKGVGYPTAVDGGTLDRAWRMGELAPAIEFQKKWRVPMYVGEFSVIRWAPKQDALNWLQETVDIFESMGWSWTYHAFREYSGWSLEHDETYPGNTLAVVPPAPQETDRAKLIKKAFLKNEEPKR
ncbi:MAG: glycoside hydrolase family 5 protein [Chthoniobacteraceae bacterium]